MLCTKVSERCVQKLARLLSGEGRKTGGLNGSTVASTLYIRTVIVRVWVPYTLMTGCLANITYCSVLQHVLCIPVGIRNTNRRETVKLAQEFPSEYKTVSSTATKL